MIITASLAWYHLPKTAGTTTERLFIASRLPLLWNDPQSSPLKHLPPSDHPDRDSLPLRNQHRILNFRRLPSWLLSNLHHKRKMMGLSLDDAPMRAGLFWRERQQHWLPADWWLDRLDVNQDWSLLRVEHLKCDFLKCLRQYQPVSICAQCRVLLVSSRNRNRYQRALQDWFSPSDLKSIYAANPRWAALEQLTYGSLVHHS